MSDLDPAGEQPSAVPPEPEPEAEAAASEWQDAYQRPGAPVPGRPAGDEGSTRRARVLVVAVLVVLLALAGVVVWLHESSKGAPASLGGMSRTTDSELRAQETQVRDAMSSQLNGTAFVADEYASRTVRARCSRSSRPRRT